MTQEVVGKCPVCKYPLLQLDELHKCPGCDTPHHVDCWQYNGGCAVFGCNGVASSNHSTEEITYTFDDLAAEYTKGKIIIELEDLSEKDVPLDISFSDKKDAVQTDKTANYSFSSLASLVWAGLVGGIIIWVLGSIFFDYEYYAVYQRFNMLLGDVVVFSALMGGIIGSCLGSVEGITSKVFSKTISGVFVGLLVGTIGAVIGSYLGQGFYMFFSEYAQSSDVSHFFMRTLTWCLVGSCIGLGQGIGIGNKERIKNGFYGGLAGSVMGGVIFDISFTIFSEAGLSALIALTLFGVSIGLGIGMVQEYRKEAWLKVIEGATRGKEYVIYPEKTTIGRSSSCDIVLVQDECIAYQQATIIYEDNKYIIEAGKNATEIYINGKLVNRYKLKYGDNIRISSYLLTFKEKK